LLTCISTLLPPERLECEVLQTRDLGLEEAEIHKRGPPVVLPLELLHPGALDAEDRHAPPVHAPDVDAPKLAATREPEGPKEEVLGLEHRFCLLHVSRLGGLEEESSAIGGAGSR
jgi:hypothetical protein